MHPRVFVTYISHISRTQIILFGCLLIILLCYIFTNLGNSVPGSFYPVYSGGSQLCLDGDLHGTKYDSGLGNVLFEVIAFLAVANKTKRNPVLSNQKSIRHIEKFVPHLPNMGSIISTSKDTSICAPVVKHVEFTTDCCRVDLTKINEISRYNGTVVAHTFYTQGIAYMLMLPKSTVLSLSQGSPDVVGIAKNKLFKKDKQRGNKKSLCVHTRRGDFLESPLVYPSNEIFTREATKFLSEKGNFSHIYVFGNDITFLKGVFHGWTDTSIAGENKAFPPNVEFEFSRLYCDTVLITASASTYGWWMGYLSRGQNVYYNNNFSRPDGIDMQMNRKQFFPSHWIPLDLVTTIKIGQTL